MKFNNLISNISYGVFYLRVTYYHLRKSGMLIRSAKIQFLFWAAFFSVMLYLWIVTVGLQIFVLPDEKPLHLPQNVVLLLFVLYGLLSIAVLAGTIISTMINNKFYQKFFSIFMMIALATLLATKSMFG
jgi:hypothetical protein